MLFALPTVRALDPNIDVDTCHGAFLFHRPLAEAMAVLSQYDLIVIDEVSMLTREQFERLLEMWKAAGKLLCLVLLGDFWQMPTVDAEAGTCNDSSALVCTRREMKFWEQVPCKDPDVAEEVGRTADGGSHGQSSEEDHSRPSGLDGRCANRVGTY